MLKISPDWEKCTTGYVVTDLLRQARALGHYPEAASAITRAAVDFMLAGPRWSDRPRPVALVPRLNGWELNGWLFHVLPDADDESVDAVAGLPEMKVGIDVLAPPWSKFLVERAVQAELSDRGMSVLGVDDFCQYRLLWTGIDLNQRRADSIRDLLRRYRNLTQDVPAITVAPTFNNVLPD